MVAVQLSGSAALSCGLRKCDYPATDSRGLCCSRRWRMNDGGGACSLSFERAKPYPVISQRRQVFPGFYTRLIPNCGIQSNYVEESADVQEECQSSDSSGELNELNGSVSPRIARVDDNLSEPPRNTSQPKDVKRELIMLSLPAIGGQALDPMVQLMETAYIGGLGSVELASAGVSISLFNIISKLFNIPLLSVATSFVAEDISKNAGRYPKSEKLQLSSVSTALFLAICIGIFEATTLVLGSGTLLSLMGIPSNSLMRVPAQRFLVLRALGAPAFVVSLALQGIFRGFKDTKTPVYCLGFGNFIAIFLFPLFMYYSRLGVYGAAISTVVSQYIVTISMLWQLNKRAVLLPPRLGELQFADYLKSGGFLIGRTLAVLFTMTLGTSMAARQGTVAMAAHQICLQVWLAVSLLTDALGAATQALIASYISKDDYITVKDLTVFALKISIVTGFSLAAILGASFNFLGPIFTKDVEVLGVIKTGVLFVSASQPLNALAFIVDGLYYGVSDFRYAAISMMVAGAISSAVLIYAPTVMGLPGVWFGLTLLMGLRTAAGFIRLMQKDGPWWFLHEDVRKLKLVG